MRVSPKERAIIASAELRADAPISVWRKDSGYRDHTVRYAMRSLLERGVIRPIPFINLHELGYTIYTVLFSTGAEKKNPKESLRQSLLKAPYVLWLGEFGGEYQYGVGFCCRRFEELISYMRDLSKKHPTAFFDKAISVQISSTIFPRRYLWTKKLNVGPLTSTFHGTRVADIDQLDERILSGITTYSTLSHRQIALKLGVPLSTVELRLKRLHERGVILANIFAVNPVSLNRQAFKLLVYTKGLDLGVTAELMKFCSASPCVTHLIDALGVWGYEIGLEVESSEEVTATIQELYDRFGHVINTIKPLTIFRYSKVRFFPEVP